MKSSKVRYTSIFGQATDRIPPSSRVRDNQRRFRTRRAELLNDLQKRVHEYERQGVAATQAMQRAARKVAQDNVRLRTACAPRRLAGRGRILSTVVRWGEHSEGSHSFPPVVNGKPSMWNV